MIFLLYVYIMDIEFLKKLSKNNAKEILEECNIHINDDEQHDVDDEDEIKKNNDLQYQRYLDDIKQYNKQIYTFNINNLTYKLNRDDCSNAWQLSVFIPKEHKLYEVSIKDRISKIPNRKIMEHKKFDNWIILFSHDVQSYLPKDIHGLNQFSIKTYINYTQSYDILKKIIDEIRML